MIWPARPPMVRSPGLGNAEALAAPEPEATGTSAASRASFGTTGYAARAAAAPITTRAIAASARTPTRSRRQANTESATIAAMATAFATSASP